jgi:aromatic ring hydroxylase
LSEFIFSRNSFFCNQKFQVDGLVYVSMDFAVVFALQADTEGMNLITRPVFWQNREQPMQPLSANLVLPTVLFFLTRFLRPKKGTLCAVNGSSAGGVFLPNEIYYNAGRRMTGNDVEFTFPKT